MSSKYIKSATGYYGKIPSKGDFIHNNVNLEFCYCWNEWMDNFLAVSKENLEEKLLKYYLTGPIWHF